MVEALHQVPHRSLAKGLLIVCAATLLATSWSLRLELQGEDYQQLREAERVMGPAALLGHDTEPTGKVFIRYFRPLLHLSFALDRCLVGVAPWRLHLISSLWHVATTALFFLLLRRFAPSRPAFALGAALLFGVHPGKWGAVTWIAARGDVLMTFFALLGLLSLERFRVQGRCVMGAVAHLCLAASLLAKEGAVILTPFFAAIDFALAGRGVAGGSRRPWFSVSLLLLGPIAWFLRLHLVGAGVDTYAGRELRWTFDVIDRMVEDLPRVVLGIVGGQFDVPVLDPTAVLLLVLAIGGIVVASCSGARSLALTFGLAIVFGASLVPPLRLYREASGVDPSRLFYLANLGACLAIARLLPEKDERRRGSKGLRRALVAAAVMTCLVLHVPLARRQFAAADAIRETIRTIEGAADASPGTGYILIGMPNDLDRVALFNRYLGAAFEPPFVDRPITVQGVAAPVSEAFFATLRGLAMPIRIFDFDPKSRSLTPHGSVLPAPTGRLVETNWPKGAATIRFEPPLVPRDIGVVSIDFPHDAEVPTKGLLELESEDGTDFALDIVLVPKGMPRRSVGIDVSRRSDWLLRPRIVSATWSCEPLGAVEISRFRTAFDLPILETEGPVDGAIFRPTDPEPDFVVADPAHHPRYRLRLRRPMVFERIIRRTDAHVDGDHVTLRLSMPEVTGAVPAFRWSQLREGSRTNLLDQLGTGKLEVEWSVEALDEDVDRSLARSKWISFTIATP